MRATKADMWRDATSATSVAPAAHHPRAARAPFVPAHDLPCHAMFSPPPAPSAEHRVALPLGRPTTAGFPDLDGFLPYRAAPRRALRPARPAGTWRLLFRPKRVRSYMDAFAPRRDEEAAGECWRGLALSRSRWRARSTSGWAASGGGDADCCACFPSSPPFSF
jgi:hypothetical protein